MAKPGAQSDQVTRLDFCWANGQDNLAETLSQDDHPKSRQASRAKSSFNRKLELREGSKMKTG